jgi:hypothetical protein
MKRLMIGSLVVLIVSGMAFMLSQTEKDSDPAEWSFNATAIEACTCPMFCQCYFNTEPAAHGHDHGEDSHYCKFNMAWQVNEGHFGETELKDAHFWIAGDLGEGWEDGQVDWAAVHFDPAVSEAQRDGIVEILGSLFPAEWESFSVEEDYPIEWSANNAEAVALLDGGSAAEMRLKHPETAMSEEPAVLTNIIYWGAPRHDGFVMMPNEVQAYRSGDKAFESNGTNGFMITVDMNSDDRNDMKSEGM